MCQGDFCSNLQTAKRKYMEKQMISTVPVGTILKHAISGVLAVKISYEGQPQHKVHVVDHLGDAIVPTEAYKLVNMAEINEESVKRLNAIVSAYMANKKQAVKETPNKSDGSSADYYRLPEGATQLQDLISHRNMNAQLGEIFRAAYRFGMASHSDQLRDAKKIKFYIEAEIKRLEKQNDV